MRVELYPLRSGLVNPGDSVAEKLVEAMSGVKVRPRNHDILAVASKVVAIAEGRLVRLSMIKPTFRAIKLGRAHSLPPALVQVVIDESDRVYGGVRGALLTLSRGIVTANAGVDQKNAPPGFVVLWPSEPELSARRLRTSLQRRLRKTLGVVIVDSRVTPLRLGTIGLALAAAGFGQVRDFRGIRDLYGRRAQITYQALADGVASAAHLLMGEARESTPFVLVRGAPVNFGKPSQESGKLSVKGCLYMSQVDHVSAKRER